MGPGQSQRRIVIATRPKRYPPREHAFQVFKPEKRRPVWVDDPGGEGVEIVREAALCAACFGRNR